MSRRCSSGVHQPRPSATSLLTASAPGLVLESIPYDAELGLQPRVCVPIRWQGELVAFILVVDADGTVTTAETSHISDVADRLAPLLVTELRGGDEEREQTVRDLVSHEGTLRRRALEELATSGVSEDNIPVTAIRLSIRGEAVEASSAHVTAAMRSSFALPKPTGSRFQLGAVEERGAVIILGGRKAPTPDTVVTYARRILARVDDLSSGRFKAVAGIGPSLVGLDRAH